MVNTTEIRNFHQKTHQPLLKSTIPKFPLEMQNIGRLGNIDKRLGSIPFSGNLPH